MAEIYNSLENEDNYETEILRWGSLPTENSSLFFENLQIIQNNFQTIENNLQTIGHNLQNLENNLQTIENEMGNTFGNLVVIDPNGIDQESLNCILALLNDS